MPRPLPRINKDSEPYWRSAKEHSLKLQRCSACGRFRFYPARACTWCHALDFDWQPISGKGEVATFSIVYRGPGSPFTDLLPLVVAMITLEEGPVMMSNVVGCPVDEVHIGMPVTISYEDVNEQVTLPVFVPAA